MTVDFKTWAASAREEHARALDAFLARHLDDVDRLAGWCAESLAAGGRLLFFGNGGSAADAQHLAAEFVNRFDRDRRALAALALTTDPSVVTSIGNDASFDEIFARQVEAHGRKGDVAIAITTSGNSRNVLRGLSASRVRGLRTAALLGRDGGAAAALADLPLVVPVRETARIQEVHIFAGHLLCRAVEDRIAAHLGDPISSGPEGS
jgi:D-sedoheptulose 7-phosphate isomerase